jgi:hypothetical protein
MACAGGGTGAGWVCAGAVDVEGMPEGCSLLQAERISATRTNRQMGTDFVIVASTIGEHELLGLHARA